MVIENNNLWWGPGGTVGSLKKSQGIREAFSSSFLPQHQTLPLPILSALRLPNLPKLHFKVSAEVR